MIRVELHERVDATATGAAGGHQVTGTLTVADDGTHHFEGDASSFPTNLHVPVLDETTGRFQQVTFQDDPATWARNLHALLRTGYLVPVITHDDLPAGTDRDEATDTTEENH